MLSLSLLAEITYAATVDLQQLTFGFYREDWPVIHKDTVLWLDEGVVRGYDFKYEKYFNLFEGVQPLSDLYGLVGYDSRFLVYNRLTPNKSLDVSFYDMNNNIEYFVTDEPGSQSAIDYDDNGTLLYIDGGACGKLYVFNIINGKNKLITNNACYGKISDNTVVFEYAGKVYGYNLNKNVEYFIANGNSPDVYKQNVVWLYANGGTSYIMLKDLHTGEENILLETSIYDLYYPSLSRDYIVYGKNTAPDISGIEGIDLKSSSVFEIQVPGSQQNSVIVPILEENIAAWMSWRTGSGDIYASEINR